MEEASIGLIEDDEISELENNITPSTTISTITTTIIIVCFFINILSILVIIYHNKNFL